MSGQTRRAFIAVGSAATFAALAGCIGSSGGSSTPDERPCATDASGCSAEDAAETLEHYLTVEKTLTARITENGGMDDIGGFASLLAEHPTPADGAPKLYENVRTIAEGYAGALADGFEIGNLEGEVVSSLNVENPNVVASWHAERDWANAYLEGVYDQQRYHDEVTATLEV